MFFILVGFCYTFFRRARAKGHAEAQTRAIIYALCGIAILVSIVVLAVDNFFGMGWSTSVPRLTFYGENVGLIAFGISWLTASRVLPGLTREDERFSLVSEPSPPQLIPREE